jgi:hypothetical protein
MPSPAVLVLDDARHVGLLAAELLANRIPGSHAPAAGPAHREELGRLAGMPRQRRTAMEAIRLPEGP